MRVLGKSDISQDLARDVLWRMAAIWLCLYASTGCGRLGFDQTDTGEVNSSVCGNSVVELGEQCDGLNLRSASCTDFGLSPTAGLRCNEFCQLDSSGCELGADCHGRWNFDEGQGTIVGDQSIYQNDGTVAAPDPELLWTTSGQGTAAHFQSPEQTVKITADPSLLLYDEMSIELWIKFDSLNENSYLLDNGMYRMLFRGGETEDEVFFSYLTEELPSGGDSLWTSKVASSTASRMVPGQWYYIVGVKTATHMTMYVNGRKEKDNRCLSDRTPDDSEAQTLAFGGQGLRGIIDEVTIWSRALPADEIKKRWVRERCLMGSDECDSLADCGNSVLDDGEQCDTRTLDGASCSDVGAFTGGTLLCASDCSFDTDDCISTAASVGSWDLNEGNGETFNDSSGNALHGSLVNMDAASSWVTGIDGTGLYFDTVSGTAVVPDQPSLQLSDDLSVEIWVNFETLNQDNLVRLLSNDIFSIGFRGDWAGNRPYFLFHVEGDVFPADSAWSGRTGVKSLTPLESGVWYHIAAVKSGRLLAIYIDGNKERELDGFIIDELQPPYNATLEDVSDLRIGESSFNGTLDNARVYERALRGAEIRQHYLDGPSTR